jgi:hypothetical protein
MPLSELKISNKLFFYLARMEARGFDTEQVLAGTGLTIEDVNVDFFRPEPGQWREIIEDQQLWCARVCGAVELKHGPGPGDLEQIQHSQ